MESKIWVLHAQPPRPVLCMSTWTQVSPGSSVPHPVNDPASITVLDRPPIAPTGCTLLGARVHYASYMRKALTNAYVSPTLKLSLEGYLCTSTLLASAPNLRMLCQTWYITRSLSQPRFHKLVIAQSSHRTGSMSRTKNPRAQCSSKSLHPKTTAQIKITST